MNLEEIRSLIDYNQWANRRIVDAVRRLNGDDFTRDLATSFGSIRGTVVHILWAEWIWLQRWQGQSPKQMFAPEEFADVGAITTRWQGVERDQQQFAAGVTDTRLKERIAYENLKGETWEYSLTQMIQHTVNHSSYHRGQIVTLLRQSGASAPSTDFLLYFDEIGG